MKFMPPPGFNRGCKKNIYPLDEVETDFPYSRALSVLNREG